MHPVVKLTSGTLAVFSPIMLTPDVMAKVNELGGNVKYLVAPNVEHHIFLSEWAEMYPGARLIGPEGLSQKYQKAQKEKFANEPFGVVFEAKKKHAIAIDPDFDRDFAYEYIDAHRNKEIVFFYKPDNALIEADLLFNLPATEQYSRVPDAQKYKKGFLIWLANIIWSTQGEALGAKRFIWYALSRKDRRSWDASIQSINKWNFKTVIPCHGDVIEQDGKAIFEKIFEWHLKI